MRERRIDDRGLVLISALLVTAIVSLIGGVLALQVVDQWRISSDAGDQLYAHSLAASGIEYGREILRLREPDHLLSGLDGAPCGFDEAALRNPIPLAVARTAEAGHWTPQCDDGYFFDPETDALFYRYDASGRGAFWIRFSNNIGEADIYRDSDSVLVLRSFGIVESRLPSVLTPDTRNHVSMVEASFRKPREFRVQGALTVFGSDLLLQSSGSEFTVQGGKAPAIVVVSPSGADLTQVIREQMDPGVASAFAGTGRPPSIGDLTASYREDPDHCRLFSPDFWDGFDARIEHFADALPISGTVQEGLYRIPDGGILEGNYRGILIGSGDITFRGNSQLRGILIHLGQGMLSLLEDTRIQGGVWMSHVQVEGETLSEGTVQLSIGGRSRIEYDSEVVDNALLQFPLTQLYWRRLFPEMMP